MSHSNHSSWKSLTFWGVENRSRCKQCWNVLHAFVSKDVRTNESGTWRSHATRHVVALQAINCKADVRLSCNLGSGSNLHSPPCGAGMVCPVWGSSAQNMTHESRSIWSMVIQVAMDGLEGMLQSTHLPTCFWICLWIKAAEDTDATAGAKHQPGCIQM